MGVDSTVGNPYPTSSFPGYGLGTGGEGGY